MEAHSSGSSLRFPALGERDVSGDPNDSSANAAIKATAVALERQFPGAMVWYGLSTRRWWAVLPAGEWEQLIEGSTPEQLTLTIGAIRSWRR